MKRINRRLFIWVFFLSISFFTQAGWIVESEVVDDTVDAGLYNSISLDSDGSPYIAYFDADNSDLRHAEPDGAGGWILTTLDDNDDVGAYCSVAVDSNGTPHVSYQYSYEQTIPIVGTVTRGELKYVSGTNGTPVTIDDTQGIMGAYTSIALNDSDAPRIAYQGTIQSGTYLWYVEKNGSDWGTPQEIEEGGAGASLVLDSNGYPHISHVDGTELRYVYWNGSSWVSQMVEDYQVEDERTSLALDSNGYPHIVYVNVEGLRYIYWDGTDWNDELVHSIAGAGSVGVSSPSLVLNSQDEPFISFHGDLFGDLAVVVAVRNGVDDWSMPAWLLEDTTPSGQTSITVDTNDVLHVSYRDETAGELSYAKVSEDTDGDWLPDWWEMYYFGDLDEDDAGDPDEDGVNNNDEYYGGSNPTVDESGGDESWDRDGDGLSNDEEVNTYGTDPDDADSDDDGILDGVETGYHLFWDSFEETAVDDRWSNSGDQLWLIDSSTAQDESQSVRSGGITNGQSSTLELEVNLLGEGVASFWFRTSCETNSDKLLFSTNGVLQSDYSGSNDWTLVYLEDVPAGTNTLRWTYEKDASGSAGDDAVWIDSVYAGVIAIGTSPTNSDSDADGLLDGAEVYTYGTSPTNSDSDADGLLDGEEISAGSDPYDADSDDDGLNDGDEVHTYGTDPTLADSDSDSMPDGWEVAYSLNPLSGTDASADGDSDGLTNLEEYQNYTAPNKSDSDSDGMPDGWEVDNVLDPNDYSANDDTDGDQLIDLYEYTNNTDPNDTDTDADGMPDGWEVFNTLEPDDSSGNNGATGDPDTDSLNNLLEYQNGTNPQSADSDDDGMPDGWEVTNALNPLVDDAGNDSDTDGLSNLQEYQNSTNPNENDTDGDAMPDGWEVNHTLNPLVDDADGDADSDGLTNLQEYLATTDPQNADTDSDGLNDGDEVLIHNTDPLNIDTDDDGLSDGQEINTYSTDPNSGDSDSDSLPDGWEVTNGTNPNSNDAAADTDTDGLINSDEYLYGSDASTADSDADGIDDGPEVHTYGTDPIDNDTDDDGMPDGWEVDNSLSPLTDDASGDVDSDGLTNLKEYQNGADPQDADSDNDELTDGEEVNIYGTEPDDSDTDADGMPDGWEINHSLNPRYSNANEDSSDTDGLTNIDEYLNGADPQDPDTDDDGLWDGEEVHTYLTDPADSDSDDDGLNDNAEIYSSTDPNDPDSDDDGLLDGYEVSVSQTDPNNPDHDSDGLSDGDEVNVYGTNPKSADSDNDGLTDYDEINTYLTGPNDSDSDDDALLDGAEVNTYLTDPKDSDSDDDGLLDGAEVNTYTTDPLDDDTDDDLMPDGWEVLNGTDPKVNDSTADDDGDGLTNLEEYQNGSGAQSADTDSDGLSDGEEVNTYGTNPSDTDSDDDGLLDGAETGWSVIDDSFEIGSFDSGWQFDGDNPWTISTSGFDGDYSAESGAGYQSVIKRTVTITQPAVMSFALWVDGIERLGDSLYFNVNGSTDMYWDQDTLVWETYMQGMYSGGYPDYEVIPYTAGTYTFEWEFWHDLESGTAKAYIDSIFFGDVGYGTDPLDDDSDDDGLTDGDEINTYETNPLAADSDNDGLNDYIEINTYSTDPMDSDADNDGLSDGAEVNTHLTNPLDNDSDDDGLSDGDEVNTHGTDPKKVDSDSDTMPDGWEVAYSLNPLLDDNAEDVDSDGLSNVDEFTQGTNPRNADTDTDGISDGDEVHTYETSPTKYDTDGDGLGDGEESVGVGNKMVSFEDGVLPDGWTTGGDVPWTVASGIARDGNYALKSPSIGPSQSGWVQYNGKIGARGLYWSYNNTNGALSYLSCTFDGVSVWQGEQNGWYGAKVTPTGGVHTLRWEYSKESYEPAGDDATYLDLFFIPIPALGTDPLLADTDGDGLSDGREVLSEVKAASESFEPEPVAVPLAMRALADAPAGGAGLPSGWSTSGDAPWSMVSDEAYDGTGSIRSGIVADFQASTLELTTNLNAGRISFWIKCSSENESDTLEFLVDGIASNVWSGEIAWTNASASFAKGLHTFQWVYAKDDSGSTGSDAAWLDLVEFFEDGIGTDPLNSDSDGDSMADGWEVNSGLDPKASTDGAADADEDGFSNKSEYIADTDPNNSNDLFRVTGMDGDAVIFNSSDNRRYTLLGCTDLVSNVWKPASDARLGTGGADSITSTNSLPAEFYKLTVELP